MEIRNVCFPVKYESQGEEKTKWINVGTMFIKEEGGETKISFVLDALPNGEKNLHAFPIRDKGEWGKKSDGAQSKPAEDVPIVNLDDDVDDVKIEDVPF